MKIVIFGRRSTGEGFSQLSDDLFIAISEQLVVIRRAFSGSNVAGMAGRIQYFAEK